MNRPWSWLAGLALILSVSRAPANVDFEFRGWFPDFSGSAQSQGNTVDGDTDLAIGDRNFPELRLRWDHGRKSSLRASYTAWKLSGDNVLNRTFQFEGTTYNVGERVLTNMNVNVVRIGSEWRPFSWPKVQVGLLANVDLLWGDLRLAVPARAVFEQVEGFVPLPSIGLALRGQPSPRLVLFGEVSGLPGGEYGHLLDWEAGARVRLTGESHVAVGYRSFEVEARDDPDFVEIKLAGPFFDAGWRF